MTDTRNIPEKVMAKYKELKGLHPNKMLVWLRPKIKNNREISIDEANKLSFL